MCVCVCVGGGGGVRGAPPSRLQGEVPNYMMRGATLSMNVLTVGSNIQRHPRILQSSTGSTVSLHGSLDAWLRFELNEGYMSFCLWT